MKNFRVQGSLILAFSIFADSQLADFSLDSVLASLNEINVYVWMFFLSDFFISNFSKLLIALRDRFLQKNFQHCKYLL